MQNKSEIVFSIIIPHKNIPHLLQRCLDSIPIRKDLEIIVVDDNSDSRIVDFSNFPGKDREDLSIIFDKSGNGAGAARNIGINVSKGKWLLFSDADDTYTSMLSRFLDEYKDNNSDVVFFKSNIVINQNISGKKTNMNYFIDSYFKGKGSIVDMKFGAWEPWNKLIRRSIIIDNEIRFDEISSSNDKMFSLLLGKYISNIQVSNEILYNYIIRSGSIMRSGKKRRFKNSFDTIIRQNSLYHKVGYKRKVFIPFFLIKNLRFVNRETIKIYIRYLKNNDTNILEGFYDYFLFYIKKKLSK